MHSVISRWSRTAVMAPFTQGPHRECQQRLVFAVLSPPVEFLRLSAWLSDVGLRPGALGSRCGALQVGPPGHLHPRLFGTAASGNCQVAGPCEVSRVSGTPAERRAGPAGTGLPDPLCPKRGASHRQLDGPVAEGGHEPSRNTQRSHRHCEHQSRYRFTRVSSLLPPAPTLAIYLQLPLEESVGDSRAFKGWWEGATYCF